MIQQILTIESGVAISSSDIIPDKRTLVGIVFPATMNGTATFILEMSVDSGGTYVEVFTSANALFSSGYTQDKVIPLPEVNVSVLSTYRIRVATNQTAIRTIKALIK